MVIIKFDCILIVKAGVIIVNTGIIIGTPSVVTVFKR